MPVPRVVGLLGHPLGHSVSPAMQEAAFRHVGLDWRYLAFEVPPQRLADAMRGMVALGLRGANVTVPHKEAALQLADAASSEAMLVGAANTITIDDEGRTVADNTDVHGFMQAWRQRFGNDAVRAAPAVIIGAGGAARAVALGLLRLGASRLTVLNRSLQRANDLIASLPVADGTQARITAAELTQDAFAASLSDARAVVQTTSVGMAPHARETPIPWPSSSFTHNVMDIIYNPRPTRFLAEAAAAGAHTEDGLAMLVAQGARAFQLWTGQSAPYDVMYAAAAAALGPHL
jgi:shikimate dehydrogenase